MNCWIPARLARRVNNATEKYCYCRIPDNVAHYVPATFREYSDAGVGIGIGRVMRSFLEFLWFVEVFWSLFDAS